MAILGHNTALRPKFSFHVNYFYPILELYMQQIQFDTQKYNLKHKYN